MPRILVSILIILALVILWWKREPSFRWIVYYGSELREQDLKGINLAIVQPEAVDPKNFKQRRTKLIAYLSIGEAETSRGDWPEVAGKPWVIEPNPNWPGSYRVDIRSQEWQEILLKKRIPKILGKGFDGLFLDTLDVPLFLEETDPKKHAGSKEALLRLVHEIRTTYREILIFPNNALELLGDYGEIIDGVVIEDLYTHYNFENKKSEPTPPAISQNKEKLLDDFKKRYRKPVLNILYETSPESALARSAIERSREKGYFWYLTTIDLMKK